MASSADFSVPVLECLISSKPWHNPLGSELRASLLLKDEETETQAGKVSGPRPQTANRSQHQGLTPKGKENFEGVSFLDCSPLPEPRLQGRNPLFLINC